jgi:ribbon-helix-helix CopG family protein
MQNITLSLPRALLRRFKRLAVDKDKSVSKLLRELMEEAVHGGDSYEQAYRSWLEDMKSPRDLGTYGKPSWTRDELHERHR